MDGKNKGDAEHPLYLVRAVTNYLITPNSLPTLVKAAIALSRSSRL